jgi:formylglycine-generating enzyme required for sulfatase activity
VRAALAVVVVAWSACTAPSNASVLLKLTKDTLPGLRAPAATLAVVDDKNKPLVVDVVTNGQTKTVTGSIPVSCDDNGNCSSQLQLHASSAKFALTIEAADRCGARAKLAVFSSDLVPLSPYATVPVDLTHIDANFDDDGDGIVNALEVEVCGRFDVKDGNVPPQNCLDANDPCCAGVSTLEGHAVAFAGGAHLRADGSNVTVAPFSLDATEVTWLQFARCVAAGACLPNQPQHPVRLKLASAVVDEPVVGLVPSEAEQLCEFFGARLPSDDEWDFASAHRSDPTVRGKYPWDDDTAAVSCTEGAAAVGANFSIPGTACAGAPVAVGSFSSSNMSRGVGGDVADLGGNVAEWTLVAGTTAPAIREVPSGNDAVVLRGGGARSPLALLENDLPVTASYPGDASTWSTEVKRLAGEAGFRCAKSVADGTVAPPFAAEPACGAK